MNNSVLKKKTYFNSFIDFSLLALKNEDFFGYKHHLVWITCQIITIFYENKEIASKFESFKSIKPFLVLFYLINNHNELQIKYINSIHEYLAK